jgi:ABC-2 type transport system permease protein
METVKNYFFINTGIMFGRFMLHIFRSMDTIITVTIMPIAIMLLFDHVSGAAIQTGTDHCMNNFFPPLLLIIIANNR